MHTSDGCSFAGKNCKGNQGCSQTGGGSSSYGDGFNANNGGVYAMEWTSDHLDIWFFGRDNVPEGVSGDSPDPSGWGEPTTTFNGGDGCDIDSHFKDQRIVFDTTFCGKLKIDQIFQSLLTVISGDWAGQVFDQDSQCSALASNCEDFVKNNPQAFAESYWTVNSLKVYCQDDSGALPQPSFTSSISVPTNITYSVPTQPVSETSFPSESPVIATVVVTSGVVTETAPPTVITFTADANGFPSPPDPNSQFEDFRNHAHAKRDRRATRHLRKHVSGRSFKRV